MTPGVFWSRLKDQSKRDFGQHLIVLYVVWINPVSIWGQSGIVLDMKTLKQIGFTVGPVVTTAVSILLGYYHQARL